MLYRYVVNHGFNNFSWAWFEGSKMTEKLRKAVIPTTLEDGWLIILVGCRFKEAGIF